MPARPRCEAGVSAAVVSSDGVSLTAGERACGRGREPAWRNAMSTVSKARLTDLKLAAKRLQRENPQLAHSHALDLVARGEQFPSWALLCKSVGRSTVHPALPQSGKLHSVLLGGIVPSRERGVLPKWWDELVPSLHREEQYAFVDWMAEHFQVRDYSETAVRRRLAKMRRAIEFMDRTGLRPSKAWMALFGRGTAPLGMDHPNVWRDADDRYIVSAEPYAGARMISSICGWCDDRHWRSAIAAEGEGIWNPCTDDCPVHCAAHTRLVLMAPAKMGGDPAVIVSRLRLTRSQDLR